VSQSPVNDFSEQATLRYKQGWRALNRLLHEDRSFSGNERDCAFLNCGGDSPSFATISTVAGFDFPDDGRGLATVDWDFDGDQDVWITCRTAPRVRFLQNSTAAKPFVAFKLRGDGITTNRDAIGARLELHLRGPVKHPVRIRTLHGGEGFISQSSDWLHFGLGEATGIEKLVVRWPGGKPQEITGLEPGKFYRVTQDRPAPEIFTPPSGRPSLTPSQANVPALSEAARIIVPLGFPIPKLKTLGPDGSPQAWEPAPGRPAVINLWATWCAPCVAELTDWAAHRDQLKAASLDVVTFNTDGLGGKPGAPPADAAALLQKLGVNSPFLRISEAGLQALDQLQCAVLDRWKPLPLPSTFLLDPNGELVAIYKGPVQSSQLLADLKLASATADQRRDACIPFPGVGQWVDKSERADPMRVANLMLDNDDIESAIDYLDRCVKVILPQKNLAGYNTTLGDLYYTAGVMKRGSPTRRKEAIASLTAGRDLIPSDLRIRKVLAQEYFETGRHIEATAEMLAATQINPADPNLRADLADLYERIGEYAKAKPILEELLAANPKQALARYRLAVVLQHLGDARGAIQNYRQTLTDSPRLLDAANDLARLLAGHPDESIRSADEALALAQRLCMITKEKDAGFLHTLSIALANKGDFPRAIEAAQKALALLPPDKQPAKDALAANLKLFESRQPYRLPAPVGTP
jgi:tetratricopeptide (TPR) repeat protein